ncbi:hypothetical protein PLICRDRAFT_103155 [Plicaturopsis crispa FD-325 SS-3]|nr:hypothetical protein PLICRDRAFT_103155 [Plicaturopsis crispa FD-325 SS-3]
MLDGRTVQSKKLIEEVRNLVWADGLLGLVYRFIKKKVDRGKGMPLPFTIPRMSFVRAGMAYGPGDDVYLVEQRIDGHFRKYLNNDSAEPVEFVDLPDQERAEFLAFTQHVQYWKTHKMAFVSDYQGGDTLLTDPQITTAPELGMIFSSGNIPAAHDHFEATHPCNKFCQYFNVPTDYDSDSAEPLFTPGVDSALYSKAMSISAASSDEDLDSPGAGLVPSRSA